MKVKIKGIVENEFTRNIFLLTWEEYNFINYFHTYIKLSDQMFFLLNKSLFMDLIINYFLNIIYISKWVVFGNYLWFLFYKFIK